MKKNSKDKKEKTKGGNERQKVGAVREGERLKVLQPWGGYMKCCQDLFFPSSIHGKIHIAEKVQDKITDKDR